MTKAFTALSILKLRDDGKLSLDAPVETYVPELRGWKYPTEDSPKIRVRELLTHTAGFVTDDPWGDRQTPLPDEDFTRLLRDGVPFTRAPATAMEYSNLGYALLGRIITNVSGHPYKDFVHGLLLAPLSMTATGYEVAAAPQERRALGYRWEDNAWKLEPTMAHGAFGAMGGIQTSATDYAKWVSYLLSAWPPRDGADTGPVRRSSVRELAQGANFPSLRLRPGSSGAEACREASTYAMGFYAASDCELGLTLSHGGGYPGYGSHVLLLPDYGVGIFALANRTYAGPRAPVWDAAVTLLRAGLLPPRSPAPSPALAAGVCRGGQDVHGGLGRVCGRRAGDELPHGSRRRTPRSRVRSTESGCRRLRHWRVDRPHGTARGRVHVELRPRSHQGAASARADTDAADSVAHVDPFHALTPVRRASVGLNALRTQILVRWVACPAHARHCPHLDLSTRRLGRGGTAGRDSSLFASTFPPAP